jgi:hypothetical protein
MRRGARNIRDAGSSGQRSRVGSGFGPAEESGWWAEQSFSPAPDFSFFLSIFFFFSYFLFFITKLQFKFRFKLKSCAKLSSNYILKLKVPILEI